MGDGRGEPTGEVSSGQAWANVTVGWADPLRTEADYAVAMNSLIEYFTVSAQRLPETPGREIVADAVTRFGAAWHAGLPARRRRGELSLGPSPKELADAVYNDVLDLLADPSSRPDVDLRGPRDQDDEWLALRAVGAKPEVVRAGLAQLVTARKRLDFLIVTQYLDLADDGDRMLPPRSAQVMARLGGEVSSEEAVRRAITAFRERLARIRDADDVEP